MNEEFSNFDFPDKVSSCLVDSWKVKLPCESGFDFCPVQCPYYFECFSGDE